MKNTLTLLGVASLGLTAQAQIANYSLGPDFTGTDVNGQTWNLYDLLDQGKTVIMDVSATWCGPCWSYHQSGALEELYNDHGPNGTDDVMVLWIEGDGTTGQSDLEGNTTESQGDWITGTPFPIIDDDGIADDYQIAYFPTIYKICPNRIVTEVGQLEAADLYAECQACMGVAETGINAAIITYSGATEACQDGIMDIPVKIQNRGTSPLTTCNLEVRENGTPVASTTWNGNLASYALGTVTFNDVAYVDPSALTVHMTTPDVDAADDLVDPNIVAFPNSQANITFNLTTDFYCGETTWRLKNSAGETVESGGPYTCAGGGGGADANTLFSYEWVLPFDCYSVEIEDSYGDGLYCQYTGVTAPNGSYSLVAGNGTALWASDEEADIYTIFFSTISGGMKVNAPVGIEENVLNNSLNVYPNPSNGIVYVNFSLDKASEVRMEVYNALGSMVRNLNTEAPAGVQLRNIDLSDLSSGVYSLNIMANGMKTSRLITITK